MDYIYIFMYLLGLLAAGELHAHKMALRKCQYILANAKRHVLLMQYRSHRRGLLAEALSLVMHCRLSI